MTNTSDTLTNPQAGSDTAPLRAKWGWIVALGVVCDRPSPRATSYLREDLKHVAVRVAEENRTMAEGVIGHR